MKVLWLTSWYPTELSPYNGDFIQRHARAAALFNDVELIYIEKDTNGRVTRGVKEIVNTNGRLKERIIYYKPLRTGAKTIDRFFSGLRYKKLYRKAVTDHIRVNGKPAFVHVHIAMKAGLTALWMKKKFGIRYILSEQWGGYMDAAKPNIRDYNAVYKHYWKKIFSEALTCTFVSASLENCIRKKYGISSSRVIPNVVDTGIFFPAPKPLTDNLRFIHISTMTWQKNTEAILEALQMIKDKALFRLDLYGTINPALQKLIDRLQLRNNVFVMGEVPQPQLAKAIQRSDALILYSRYETFGCVLIEANACGVPVIVSDLEVFHELVRDGENGIFAAGEQAAALADKIKWFIAKKDSFNKAEIAKTASAKYNFGRVGDMFNQLYEQLPV